GSPSSRATTSWQRPAGRRRACDSSIDRVDESSRSSRGGFERDRNRSDSHQLRLEYNLRGIFEVAGLFANHVPLAVGHPNHLPLALLIRESVQAVADARQACDVHDIRERRALFIDDISPYETKTTYLPGRNLNKTECNSKDRQRFHEAFSGCERRYAHLEC